MNKWTRAKYQVNLPLYPDKPKVTASDEHLELARKAAREGMILLKNDNSVLPLKGGTRVALFGKGTFDYVKGGGGSGDVTCAYTINLYDGLKQQAVAPEIYEPLCDFYRQHVHDQMKSGAVPGMLTEPDVPDELLEDAAEFTDTAIISISRFSGEAWDRKSVSYPNEEGFEKYTAELSRKLFPESDFYLTEKECRMVENVCDHFSRIIVVLNVGGLMDAKWYALNEKISSVLLAWQGGMMGGLAAADLLMGAASPCGKLPDTLAADLDDYPFTSSFHKSWEYVEYKEDIYVGYRYFETIPGQKDKVIFPFGYGLSFTTFRIDPISVNCDDNLINIRVKVTNSGKRQGREVAAVYCGAPQGLLGKPSKVLVAFAKSKMLEPGESQELAFQISISDLASFDDCGVIAKSAWVLEKGDYHFFIGGDVRNSAELDFVYNVPENLIVKQLTSQLAPSKLVKRLFSDGKLEDLTCSTPYEPLQNELGLADSTEGLCLAPAVRAVPARTFFGHEEVISFDDVADGKYGLNEFMAQLSLEEKIHLLGGQPNTGVANTFGIGNLPEYDVPSVMTADGPAGLRIRPECSVYTTSFPCSTLLASTWDPELVEKVGFAAGEEVKENNISVWLTPAVNIHRSPLCGRNFEYYSEDPMLAGVLSGAMIRGIQANGISAEIKHFCCNNKETNRRYSDSRVSERALREIYLKVFETAIKIGHPWALMTSYNLVNGRRCSESVELLQNILRDEWGFDGVVTTDWWNAGEQYKEIIAGNDVKMGCGFPDRVKTALAKGLITEEDIDRCVKRVLEFILRID